MKPQNVSLEGKTILVTGAAGFIGSNLVLELLRTTTTIHIVGIDNMNDYYDVSIKEYRLTQIEKRLQNTTTHPGHSLKIPSQIGKSSTRYLPNTSRQ